MKRSLARRFQTHATLVSSLAILTLVVCPRAYAADDFDQEIPCEFASRWVELRNVGDQWHHGQPTVGALGFEVVLDEWPPLLQRGFLDVVDRRGEFMHLGGRIPAKKDVAFTFNCYDAPSGSTARARIDEGPWQTMARFKYKSSPIDKPHHWRLVTDTTKLGPGRHTIQAHVTWPDGTVVVEKGTFVAAD